MKNGPRGGNGHTRGGSALPAGKRKCRADENGAAARIADGGKTASADEPVPSVARRRNEAAPGPSGANPRTPPGKENPVRPEHREAAGTELRRTLAGFGAAAPLLEKAVAPLLAGGTRAALRIVDGRAVIPYPEGARTLGTPAEVLARLARAGALAPDPILPGRKLRDVAGGKAIVLVKALSDAVTAALATPRDERENDADRPRKGRATVPAPPAAGEGDRTARPPGAFGEATEPGAADPEAGLSGAMTPAAALAALKEMIRDGSGRWLVHPVVEENGYLVTDERAFDRIAAENPGIGRHLLRGLSSGAQRAPALRLRGGKLYLKKEEER